MAAMVGLAANTKPFIARTYTVFLFSEVGRQRPYRRIAISVLRALPITSPKTSSKPLIFAKLVLHQSEGNSATVQTNK